MKLIANTGISFSLIEGFALTSKYPFTAYYDEGDAPPTTSGICNTSSLYQMPTGTTSNLYWNLTAAALRELIAKSPVLALVHVDINLFFYHSGIFSCSGTTTHSQLNHAVEVFGYDTSGNYIIKNSYSAFWGSNGFATISGTGDCGLTLAAVQFDDGTNSTVLSPGKCNVYQAANFSSTNYTSNNDTNNDTLKFGYHLFAVFQLTGLLFLGLVL